jgi:hypothetical protein
LQQVGLVSAHRSGNQVLFSVEPSALLPVFTWLERVGSRWDKRLVALRKLIGTKR